MGPILQAKPVALLKPATATRLVARQKLVTVLAAGADLSRAVGKDKETEAATDTQLATASIVSG